jgi:hypothetical protein
MARIIVQSDGPDSTTLLDERYVRSFHMEGESAMHLLERLAWAIEDAERRRGGGRGFARRRHRTLSENHAVTRALEGPFE